MHIESVLVTGANRGIGLEFVRQLTQLSDPPRFLFATYRNWDTAKDLKGIRDSAKETQVILIKMDVTKTDDRESAKKIVADMVGERGLNLLINNAGAGALQRFQDITEENMISQFTNNAVGPVMVFKEMLSSLQKAVKRKDGDTIGISRAAVLNISSEQGSLTKATKEFKEYGAAMGYMMSKAALNMAMVVASNSVEKNEILVVNMCPGWVKTDLGTEQADLEVHDSVSTMIRTLPTLNKSHHGTFIDRNGDTIPF